MANYSISDLEQLTGIKAHTIRIWESRYKILTPWRSPGNTRYYDDDQLRKLLNIVSLYQSGMKISRLSSLSEPDINQLIQSRIDDSISEDSTIEYYISQLIVAGLNYDEVEFDSHFMKCERQFGLLSAYNDVILPMLDRIGLMWGKDSLCPAQEHFITNLIRRKIDYATNQLPVSENHSNPWLLFLPESEEHELGLLFANYMLRSLGLHTIYLGSKVPLNSLRESIRDITPKYLFCFVVHKRSIDVASQYVDEICREHRSIKTYVAGREENTRLLTNECIHHIDSIKQLEIAALSHD